VPLGAGYNFRFTVKKASAATKQAFSRHPALAEFHNHGPRAAAVVKSATIQPLSAY